MPSIAEATRGRRGRRRRRIAAGIGLLLAGGTFVAIGAAGAAQVGAVRNGAVIGGLAVLCGLVLLADRATVGDRERSVAAVGAVLGLAGLFAFWSLPAGAGLAEAAPLTAATLYAFGVAVILGAVLAAASPPIDDGSTADSVAWERSADPETERSRDATADGGAGDGYGFPHEDD